MGFQVLAYSAVQAGAATYTDMVAAADAVFTARNNHYIFSEQYQLLADFVDGATITNARYQVPTWNAIGEVQIWPPNRGAAVIPSNPQMVLYPPYTPRIPMNEELQVQATCGGAETDYAALFVGTPDWNRNLPGGIRQILEVRATASVAKTLNSWSGLGPITLASGLRGGVYSMLGADCFCANALFFRLAFPRSKLYNNRALRPGQFCMNAISDIPYMGPDNNKFLWGTWGFFHTFELPQIEVYGNVAGAATQELRLWLGFHGESLSLLDSLVGQGA